MTSLAELVGDYLEETAVQGRSASTATSYAHELAIFVSWLGREMGLSTEKVRLERVTHDRLRRFRVYLGRRTNRRNGRPLSASTRNHYHAALRSFLRYCRRQRKLPTPDPDEALPLAKESDIEIRELKEEEVFRIIDATRTHRDRALLEAMYATACRLSEVLSMKRAQVDFARRQLEVIGKGGKARVVTFSKRAARRIDEYLASRTDDSPWLFVSNHRDQRGEPRRLSPRQAQHIVTEATKRAGIRRPVSPHWFRHARLSRIAEHLGVVTAQRVAGHANVAQTSRYLHAQKDVRRALDELDAESSEAQQLTLREEDLRT